MNIKELKTFTLSIDELLSIFKVNLLDANPGYEFKAWDNTIPADILKDNDTIQLVLQKI